jgi:hypothetical protein
MTVCPAVYFGYSDLAAVISVGVSIALACWLVIGRWRRNKELAGNHT